MGGGRRGKGGTPASDINVADASGRNRWRVVVSFISTGISGMPTSSGG